MGPAASHEIPMCENLDPNNGQILAVELDTLPHNPRSCRLACSARDDEIVFLLLCVTHSRFIHSNPSPAPMASHRCKTRPDVTNEFRELSGVQGYSSL